MFLGGTHCAGNRLVEAISMDAYLGCENPGGVKGTRIPRPRSAS